MTQLLALATRFTTDSATLIDHLSQSHFTVIPDCGLFDIGSTDHCVTSL